MKIVQIYLKRHNFSLAIPAVKKFYEGKIMIFMFFKLSFNLGSLLKVPPTNSQNYRLLQESLADAQGVSIAPPTNLKLRQICFTKYTNLLYQGLAERGGNRRDLSFHIMLGGNYKRPKSKFAVWDIGVVFRG